MKLNIDCGIFVLMSKEGLYQVNLAGIDATLLTSWLILTLFLNLSYTSDKYP